MWLRAFVSACLVLVLTSCSAFYDYLGGHAAKPPQDLAAQMSPLAKQLIEAAAQGMAGKQPVDHHMHMFGMGTGLGGLCPGLQQDGIWFSPDYLTWAHPVLHIKLGVLLSAAGVKDLDHADEQYVERIVDLVRYAGLPRTYLLYAFDVRHEGPVGSARPDLRRGDMLIPNQTVIDLASCLNGRLAGAGHFVPVISVHPYKANAVQELLRFADQGVRFVKWLPPAQNIDPANPMLVPFYQAMQSRRMVLLSHTGDEHTFRVDDADQDLADPIRLSLPAELGVTVVMLHSGRSGEERQPATSDHRTESYFDRFVEMMRRYPQVFGEIAVIPYLGTHTILHTLLADPDLRCRLVDGTDYPNPALWLIRPTGRLLDAGYLRWPEDQDDRPAQARKQALDEIFSYNPLLFDFVLKRTIRVDGRPIPAAAFFDIETKTRNPKQGCATDR
jgi:hypothetical protein